MKTKLLIITVFLLVWVCGSAQTDVTKFLGIPVDGTKSEMISKLEKKGFVWDKNLDYLKGEFNGADVLINIKTNKNKVYRIVMIDAYSKNEAGIKTRFNTLCSQFENNKKYISVVEAGGYSIPDNEDIAHSMSVKKKTYEAIYYQRPEQENGDASKKPVWFIIVNNYDDYSIIMYYDNVYNQANGEDL